MTWNRFVSLLEVSLQSLGFLGCSEGEPGGGYNCPKLVPRVSEILLIDFIQNFQIDLWLQGRQSVNVKVWADFYAPNLRYHLKHKKISQNGGA